MKINNKVILGAAAGILGNAAASVIGRSARGRRDADRTEIAAVTASALSAIPFTYIMAKTGRDNALIKGALYGFAVWLSLSGLREQNANTAAKTIVFGVVTSLLICRLGDPRIFKENDIAESADSEQDFYDDMEDGWAISNKVYNIKYIH